MLVLTWLLATSSWGGPYGRAPEPAPESDVVVLERSLGAQDRFVAERLLLGTPADRRALLEPLYATTSKAIAAHLRRAPTDPAAARLALRTLLRRKGQLLDAEYDTLDAVRRGAKPGDQALIDQVVEATTTLATQPARTRRRRQRVAREALVAEVDGLRRELADRVASYAKIAMPTTVAEVAESLEPTQRLVEIAVYRAGDSARYAAYVLDRSGGIVAVDLGDASEIDLEVRRLRGALIGRTDPTTAAQALSARFAPLRIPDADPLVVAADGLLNFVPFELVLGRRSITYVTTGRDLTHLGAWKARATAPMVISDVDFGRGQTWAPLPGAAREGATVSRLFPDARTLTGSAATEEAFRALERPTFLHVATHGFFLAQLDPATFAPASLRGIESVSVPGETTAPETAWTGTTGSPALRSGIVLAGANLPTGEEDGRVTAAELSNLDLRSTRVAVLSACETALGEVRNGDGVHGLRRALMLAGTHAQVLSLWKVDDAATEAWMTAFYTALAQGAPVGEAVTVARDAVAADPRWTHPFFWAAFTLSGNPQATL